MDPLVTEIALGSRLLELSVAILSILVRKWMLTKAWIRRMSIKGPPEERTNNT